MFEYYGQFLLVGGICGNVHWWYLAFHKLKNKLDTLKAPLWSKGLLEKNFLGPHRLLE